MAVLWVRGPPRKLASCCGEHEVEGGTVIEHLRALEGFAIRKPADGFSLSVAGSAAISTYSSTASTEARRRRCGQETAWR